MAAPTPTRPVPGNFINTPAPKRSTATQNRPPPAFRVPSNPGLSNLHRPLVSTNAPSSTSGALSSTGGNPMRDVQSRMSMSMAQELRFPSLDDYIIQGISSDYDNPAPKDSAWAPFERSKNYDIPDRIFEQLNQAQVSTKLGLFSELHHAWASVDGVLYIWDYTHPNPELTGCDELSSNITEVRLATPKPLVFRPEITHVLIIATTADIAILGLSATKSPEGVTSITLYQTDLRVPLKNLQVNCIEASSRTGRVFFACSNGNDVYEVTYQKEEKWFSNKSAKINHTAHDYVSAFVPTALVPTPQWLSFASVVNPRNAEFVSALAIDDSRDFLYALSNFSTIRVFHIKEPNTLTLIITRKLSDIMGNVLHMVPSTNMKLFPKQQSVRALVPISRTESARLALVITTVTGVRLYLSISSGFSSYLESSSIPSSMQVHHIKFPPPDSQPTTAQPSTSNFGTTSVDTGSMVLHPTKGSCRYSPGFQFWVVSRDNKPDSLYVTAPESAKLARMSEMAGSRFLEVGQWIDLPGKAEAMGLITPAFSAANSPAGFGNELAVQFDQPATEVAVLTNAGIHILRRRRLVDSFASALRACATEEDFENAIKRFVRNCGRVETISCALGVVCGQALDGPSDSRAVSLTDGEVVAYARRTITEHGGKAEPPDAIETSAPGGRHSPRAQAVIDYTSRIVRSVWRGIIIKEGSTPQGGPLFSCSVPLAKLHSTSSALVALKRFLDDNKSYIPGLGGPEEMNRVTSPPDRAALNLEHSVLDSQLKTIANVIEGIAFLAQLFDQPVAEIVMTLADSDRTKLKSLTFEELFTSSEGKALAKELVKAIVNRSISAGSNVETVADALRRKCGSFCSADDVVIFKAQESLQKAAEAGADTATGRGYLNESLKLFEKVAGSLSTQYLQNAVDQYIGMSFYAGAIQLCLTVALQRDRANRALAWIKDGQPKLDSRADLYTLRIECYNQIWRIIEAVDAIVIPSGNESISASISRRQEEAYSVIDLSEDEVFQNCLYDWYLSKKWPQRLLDLSSPFVVTYLQRRGENERESADLLWKYYAHHKEPFEAAKIQLQLAKSGFSIDLPSRIEYLSRAKANASIKLSTFGRLNGSKQEIMRDITDQLDCASIQLDVLRRLENDDRLQEPNRAAVLTTLNGQVRPLDDLYHEFVCLAAYHDLALVIYHLSDYRNSQDIAATWTNMIQTFHQEATKEGVAEPYVAVQSKVHALGQRVNCSENVFNPTIVVYSLLAYICEPLSGPNPSGTRGPPEWPVEMLLSLGVQFDSVLVALENALFNEAGWTNSRKRIIASLIVSVCGRWLDESNAAGAMIGGEDGAAAVMEALRSVDEGAFLSGQPEQQLLREALEAVQRVL